MRHVDQSQLLASDELVVAPEKRACDDQTFELPVGIYIAMAVMFTGFVVVLSVAFRGGMAVSYGVIFAFLAAFFGIPPLFPRLARANGAKALQWHDFASKGIDTATGRASAVSATALILVLPVLMLCFAIAVATIAALV